MSRFGGWLAGCFLGLVAISAAWAQPQPIVLKFANFEPPTAPFTARVFIPWAEEVTKASNGLLKVEMYTGGTLGRSPLQQLKLVQDGVADLTWTVAGYTPGRFDDTEVVELPFIVNNSYEGSMTLTRLLAKDVLVGFADLKLVFLGNVPPVSIHGKFPLKSLADLKGKRMRVGSSIGARIVESMGAVPVLIGAPATTEAISKGVVDKKYVIKPDNPKTPFARMKLVNFFYTLEDDSRRVKLTRVKMEVLDQKGLKTHEVPKDEWTFDCELTSRQRKN